MSKVFYTLFFFFGAACFLGAQNFQESIDNWSHDPDLKNASISIQVINLNSQVSIGSLNPNQALVPASTQKLFTTASTLIEFERSHQFETKVYISGLIQDGVLKGDLILKGSGDPSFASKYSANLEKIKVNIIKAIQGLQITEIEGRIIADARVFGDYTIPRTWIWEDMGNYYGAGVSGLTINDNMFKLYMSSGTVGEIAKTIKIEPEIDGLSIKNEVKGSSREGDNAYIFGAPYQMERIVRGSIPANQSNFMIKGSIPNPTLFAAQFLKTALINSNVSVKGVATTYRQIQISDFPKGNLKLIHSEKGLPVSKLVYHTNQRSLNLYAEHLLCLLGKEKFEVGTTEQGLKAVRNSLEKKNVITRGLHLVDGSGLSRFNAVSGNHLTRLLVAMQDNADFRKSLPVAGVSGSLAGMLKNSPAKGNLQAKSGYMERVRSYAGYVKLANGEEVAFAFMVNNYNCSASQMRLKLENLMDSLSRIE